MTAATLLHMVIRPTLAELPPRFQGQQAECMLLVIAMQESGLRTRQQTKGPARGWWQFELTTGVTDFVKNGLPELQAILRSWAFALTPVSLWTAIGAGADNAACLIARDRLFRMIEAPLPAVGDTQTAWHQYDKAWGPGKPSTTRWASAYPVARDTVIAT